MTGAEKRSRSGSLLAVAPSAYPLGGVATWLDYLVPGLQALGWDTKVGLACGRLHDPQAYLAAHPGLPAVGIANPTGSREGRVRALARVIETERSDIVAGVNIPDAYAAVRRMRLSRTVAPRAVMTVHGIESHFYEDLRRFRDVLDGVVCTNRLACSLAVEKGGIEESRVYYAPYGVALPESVDQEPRGNALRIAFIGRLEESQKRVSDLAAIAEALEGQGVAFTLNIAGEGPDGPLLRRRLEPLVSRGRVRFLGAVTHAEVQQRLYPVTDVLLVTSSWETGPIVIWEAMANRVPVVTSAYIGSGREGALKDRENCLLFPVGQIERAAAALTRLRDADLVCSLVAGGRKLVEERFALESSVKAWHEALLAVKARFQLPVPIDPGETPPTAGRLDRWLGIRVAETVRTILGRKFSHRDPGGEWPHSYGRTVPHDRAFWDEVARLDAAAP